MMDSSQENVFRKKTDPESALNSGHRERLRNRYLKAGGIDGFAEYDMVELLLTYALPRRDVKPVARELLMRFKNLAGLMDADVSEIAKVKGMGSNSALLFKLTRDFCTCYLKTKMDKVDILKSTDEVRDYARMKLAEYNEEVILLVFLDVRHRVIESHIAAKGTVDSAVVYPRNIAAEALRNQATSVIIVHNHPSGDTDPSLADRRFTRQVQEALRALDIHLLDHLIVSRYSSFSFLDHGILEVL